MRPTVIINRRNLIHAGVMNFIKAVISTTHKACGQLLCDSFILRYFLSCPPEHIAKHIVVHDIFFALFGLDYELAIKPLANFMLMVVIFELLVLLVVQCFTLPFTMSSCPLQGLTDDPLKDLIQLLVTETRHHDAVAFIEVSSIISDHYLI